MKYDVCFLFQEKSLMVRRIIFSGEISSKDIIPSPRNAIRTDRNGGPFILEILICEKKLFGEVFKVPY